MKLIFFSLIIVNVIAMSHCQPTAKVQLLFFEKSLTVLTLGGDLSSELSGLFSSSKHCVNSKDL